MAVLPPFQENVNPRALLHVAVYVIYGMYVIKTF